ncbi:MAG: endolytic transglycosylase MltG [Oscillospiraceae bacterium]
MNNNDNGKGLGSNEEFEELLRRYAVINSDDEPEKKPAPNAAKQQREKFNLSISFDDDFKDTGSKSPKKRNKHIDMENEQRYKGEVYFSSKSRNNNEQPNANNLNNNIKQSQSQRQPSQSRPANNRKPGARVRNAQDKKVIMIYIGIIVTISICLSAWSMSCINDVFAFNRDNEVISVTIPKEATTGKIIGILHDNKLIKNSLFCRFFMNLTLGMRDVEPKYLPGVYYVRPDMGVEKMLTEFQETKQAKTVTVSFPEGWTVDKMAERLMKNGVCTEQAFYENLEQAMFDYKFVKEVKGKKDRYHNLEGYLYPSTYEFFVGENPSSVIDKMLKKFKVEWTPEYDARAKELGMTVDEVITLASIIQKEAGFQDQMKNISSVFHNRLKNPANFPSLQSDATASYVTNCIRYGINSSEYDSYLYRYNTYNLKGLPAGAICNPGAKAIEAALYPAQTDYYYFCHNTETKEIYLAKTITEHNSNKIKAELTPAEDTKGD